MKKSYCISTFLLLFVSFFAYGQCDSDAGTMDTGSTYTACFGTQGEHINVPAAQNAVLDADDVIAYVMHDLPGSTLGTVLQVNDTNLNFDFHAETMTPNETYYISSVVGNDDGTGTVDLSDPCVSVAAGTPVVFSEQLITFLPDIVDLDCSQAAVELTCDGNFEFVLPNGDYSCTIVFDTPGTFTYQIVDFLTGCVYDQIITVVLPPEIIVVIDQETELNCENTEGVILNPIVTGGTGPYTFVWISPAGDVFSEEAITVVTEGTYCLEITDAANCQSIICYTTLADFSDCANIEGTIFRDEDGDCSMTPDDLPLAGRVVQATNTDGDEFFGYSHEDGQYYILAPPGDYSVAVLDPNPAVWQPCPAQNVTLTDADQTVVADLGILPLLDCPILSVDIGTWITRRCFEMNYAVQYCNQGTVTAEDAYLDVYFDDFILVQGADLPFTNPEPNIYRFDLGTVAVGECNTFLINSFVDCNAPLGYTACAEATIYPHDPCVIDPAWSGASLQVTGTCTGDEVIFNIENVGTGDMDMPTGYIVIEDGVMLMTEPAPVDLDAGDVLTLPALAADGATYIVQVMQVPGHPGFSVPTAAVQACGTDNAGSFSTGFINQFPLDENDAWVSEDCHIISGSYDPNDKTSFPRGYGEENFIDLGQDLEYLIRFQNTGNDTAFTVRIDDVLAPELDITTLRAGAGSHDYELSVRGTDTLEFLFNDIMLPDSFVNEPASHGFVRFKISQREDLPLGTIIENTAGIYFDFNEAIITNTVTHTLGENFIEITGIQPVFAERLRVDISPNPVREDLHLTIQEVDFQKGILEIFDATGRKIGTHKFTQPNVSVRNFSEKTGLHFYKIYLDGEFAASGKFIRI